MNALTIIAILIVGGLFTIIAVLGVKNHGPWGSTWTFFLVLCLSLTATTLWIPPAAPVWLGIPWIDLLFSGLLLSLILVATATDDEPSSGISSAASKGDGPPLPSHANKTKTRTSAEHFIEYNPYMTTGMRGRQHKSLINTGGLFWTVLLILCALIIAGVI